MAENMEVDPAPPFGTFHLLKLVKDSQQMHGLRHNDYKRYSDYCNRRMRRLRKSLKFTHQHKCFPKHKAKFQPKKITPEIITDLRLDFIRFLLRFLDLSSFLFTTSNIVGLAEWNSNLPVRMRSILGKNFTPAHD